MHLLCHKPARTGRCPDLMVKFSSLFPATAFLLLLLIVHCFTADMAGAVPAIDSVTPAAPLNEAQTGVLIDGSGFSATPTVYLTKVNDWSNPDVQVAQVITNSSDTQIEITVATCDLTYSGVAPWIAYLWVVDSTGTPNATGFTVQLGSVKDNSPPSVSAFQDGQSSPQIFPPGGYLSSGLDEAYPILQPVFTVQSKFYESVGNGPVDCYWSYDDGATWIYFISTNPMSTGAVYCINNNATAPNGPAAIKMRACSPCGGCADTVTKSKFVDAAGPDSGASFTATPTADDCNLEWAATTDSGIGMHATSPYEVRRDTGTPTADPPNTCSGTLIYQGTGTSKLDTAATPTNTYYFKLCYKDNFGNVSSYSGNPIECTIPGISLKDGAAVSNSFVKGSSTNALVDTFTLKTNATASAVNSLTVTGTNTANISTVKLYRDDGSAPNLYDAGDTLLAQATFSGDTAVFADLNVPVSATELQYLVTYDLVASPTNGQTLTGRVTWMTGQHSFTLADFTGATLGIDTSVPITSDNTPAGWRNAEITITLTPNDSSVDIATGIYGCLGTGCTPALLGGKTMTTNCGAGNTCFYDVRYYSIDRVGNQEAIKTAVNKAMVDRLAPTDGSLTAVDNSNPLILNWPGISDNGSGINFYTLVRTDGATPPANCASGTYIYQGSNTSFSDSSISSGQQYAYRLCASDAAGNVNSGYVATATAGEPCTNTIGCGDCHGPAVGGPPPIQGGSKLTPPGGHTFHPFISVGCGECHINGGTPEHVDGIVTSNPLSGYWGGDRPWPTGGGAMGCGGPGNPVGGTPSGGMMGCHATGTARYPMLTPEWTCIWDDMGTCLPPP